MGRFWERYLFGDDRDFCWIVKKIEKSSKFFGHFVFFLEDTCLGQSGQNTGFRKEKSKKVRKSQTTSGFSSKILVWSDPMATLTTTLNEQKGTQSWHHYKDAGSWQICCVEKLLKQKEKTKQTPPLVSFIGRTNWREKTYDYKGISSGTRCQDACYGRFAQKASDCCWSRWQEDWIVWDANVPEKVLWRHE